MTRTVSSSLLVASIAALVAGCSSSSPPPPDPSNQAVHGAFDGKPFDSVTAVAYENEADAGPGVAHETLVIFEKSVDCGSYYGALQSGRYLQVSFTGDGAEVDLATSGGLTPAGGVAQLVDYGASPPLDSDASGGTLNVTKLATKWHIDNPPLPESTGHVRITMTTASGDHVEGETDYIMCP